MEVRLLILFITFLISSCKSQKDPHWPHARNTIVHLFEWKWKRIAEECEDFLQHKGYGGVQISPPTENVVLHGRPWYERYQPISYKLITRSGNEEDFLNMTKRCNAVGVRIYPDMIINHMSAPVENATGTGGSKANPNSREYPAVPYSPDDFHSDCSIFNFQDINEVRNCALHGLKDLNQGEEYVRGKIIDLLNHLIDLGVAGFRIDAARHMWPEDLQVIYGRLKDLNVNFGFKKGSRPFIYQEVSGIGDGDFTGEEYVRLGVVTEFKYEAELSRVFSGKDKLKYLRNWGEDWGLLKSKDSIVFVDNHDHQRSFPDRILTYKRAKQYKMANAFMLAHPFGVTKIMSSFDFNTHDDSPPQDQNGNIISPKINKDDSCSNGWICEHRWRQIYNMIGFKNVVAGTDIINFWTNDDQQIAFCRGNKGFIAFTNWGDLKQELQTCLPAGNYCDIISGNLNKDGSCSGKVIHVQSDGKALIELLHNEFDGVLAIHINSTIRRS